MARHLYCYAVCQYQGDPFLESQEMLEITLYADENVNEGVEMPNTPIMLSWRGGLLTL